MKLPELPDPIYQSILNESKSRSEPVGRYHVTEVIYCLQKVQLIRAALATRRADSAIKQVSWVLFRGQVFHKAFQPLMGNGIPVEYTWTTKQGDKVTLIGEADWIESDEKGPLVGELKTAKNISWYIKNGPGPEHIKQAAAYMWMLNNMGQDINRTAFYYMDMSDIERIPVVFDREKLDLNMSWLKDRVERLHVALKNNEIADLRIPWKESWECNPAYCPFTEFCHPDYPFDPPSEHPDLETWWAGPMKVARHNIEDNIIPTEAVKAILEEAGLVCSWR